MDQETEFQAEVIELEEIRAKAKAIKLLHNYIQFIPPGRNKQPIKNAASADVILKQLEELVGQEIKNIHGSYFVHENSKLSIFGSAKELFGYLSSKGVIASWSKVETMLSKEEFFSAIKYSAKSYSYITDAPHVPQLPGVFYIPREKKPTGFKLYELLDLFTPYSELDRKLLLCAMVTPMWGGPAGSRPLFVFDGDEQDVEGGRGIGKSKFSEVIGEIYGGAVELNLQMQNADETTKKRLLDAHEKRVVRYDNVKSLKADSQILEHLITAPVISGHKMYHGLADKPNYFTYLMTFNGANLSKDLAKRSIVIKLKRPKYETGWEERVNDFKAKYRHEILDEIQELLEAKTPTYPIHSRFSLWEKEVAQKIFLSELTGENCLSVRQMAVDADKEQIQDIEECFYSYLSQIVVPHGMGAQLANPQETCFLISKTVAVEWVKRRLGLTHNSSQISVLIKRAKLELLEGETKYYGVRYWIWNKGKLRAGYRITTWPMQAVCTKDEHVFRD